MYIHNLIHEYNHIALFNLKPLFKKKTQTYIKMHEFSH